MAGAVGVSRQQGEQVLGRFHVAWRTSVAAVAQLDTDLADLAARTDLPPDVRFIVDTTHALVGVRLRRPGAQAAIARQLDDFAGSPLARDPELVQLAATAAVVLVEPERIRPLARSVLRLPGLDEHFRARLMYVVGIGDAWSGDLVRGHLGLREARELARTSGALVIQGESTCLLGKVEALLGHVDAAQAHLDEGRSIAVLAGSEWIAGGYLECSLVLHLVTGDADAYRTVLDLLAAQDHGLDSGLLWEYRWELATVHARAGDLATARLILDASRPIPPVRPGSSALPAWRAWILAPDEVHCVALERAATALNRPTERLLAARLHWLLGVHHAEAGREVEAVRLLHEAARRYAAMGAIGPLARVDERLRGMRAGQGREPVTTRHTFGTGALTEAERRVAIAVSAGLSNREAAESLFLSVRTIESHLAAVFRKLGVRNRTELALRR